MDQVVILNRIGCLMTITSQNLIYGFEIAHGPITTSIRMEPYEYAAHPFSYTRETLAGRLEIWDSTGRLVFSMRRTNLPTGARQQRTLITSQTPRSTLRTGNRESLSRKSGLTGGVRGEEQRFITPSLALPQALHGDLDVKRERASLSLEFMGETRHRKTHSSTASSTISSQDPSRGPDLSVRRASQGVKSKAAKRKRSLESTRTNSTTRGKKRKLPLRSLWHRAIHKSALGLTLI